LPLHHLVEKLTEYHAAPPLQGFGISAPDQVTAAIDAGAAGAISGSAIVKIIEKNLDKPAVMLEELGAFVRAMKANARHSSVNDPAPCASTVALAGFLPASLTDNRASAPSSHQPQFLIQINVCHINTSLHH
jgi:hypothetical protein